MNTIESPVKISHRSTFFSLEQLFENIQQELRRHIVTLPSQCHVSRHRSPNPIACSSTLEQTAVYFTLHLYEITSKLDQLINAPSLHSLKCFSSISLRKPANNCSNFCEIIKSSAPLFCLLQLGTVAEQNSFTSRTKNHVSP